VATCVVDLAEPFALAQQGDQVERHVQLPGALPGTRVVEAGLLLLVPVPGHDPAGTRIDGHQGHPQGPRLPPQGRGQDLVAELLRRPIDGQLHAVPVAGQLLKVVINS
jgi:hypothetical protein